MKIHVGTKFRACEGIAKGQYFTVISVSEHDVIYRSDKTGMQFTHERKSFEKFLERTNKYWSDTNKHYKRKKQDLKGE